MFDAGFDWERQGLPADPVRRAGRGALLSGDVALADGEPAIHAHVVVGRRDGSEAGGHLLEATVRPTLELILMETPAHLRKREGAESGLALIDLDAADDG